MSFVFGNELPTYIIRGDGKDPQSRLADTERVFELVDRASVFFTNHKRHLPSEVYLKIDDEGMGHKNLVLPTAIISCFAVLREQIIRHWPLNHVKINEYSIGGRKNPFDLCKFRIKSKAFRNVCMLISDDHQEVDNLKVEDVMECDKVVQVLNLDKYRAWYFSRSRQNDESYNYYDLELVEPSRTSLDINDISNHPLFTRRALFYPNNFHGCICRVFKYEIPDDVLAVQYFHVYVEHWGGNISLHHLTPTHHTFSVISSEDNNNWWLESYEEKFDEVQMLKKIHGGRVGYQDIIANGKGGDTIELWLESNGYDSARFIRIKMRVLKKLNDQSNKTSNELIDVKCCDDTRNNETPHPDRSLATLLPNKVEP